MKKLIGKKEYDTEKAEVIKRKVCGSFGDPEGYEQVLYRDGGGSYFFYVNGGAESEFKKEDIKRVSAKAAEQWLEENK